MKTFHSDEIVMCENYVKKFLFVVVKNSFWHFMRSVMKYLLYVERIFKWGCFEQIFFIYILVFG